MKIFSKNTWGVDVNNAWPLTCKASCLKNLELRPLISGFYFALSEVRNLCVASRLTDGESIYESANTPNVYLQCVGIFYYRSRVNHS
jgi:hypothetical protein